MTTAGPCVMTTTTAQDYKVADLSQAFFGRQEMELAEHEMPGLMALREEYRGKAPLSEPEENMFIMPTVN